MSHCESFRKNLNSCQIFLFFIRIMSENLLCSFHFSGYQVTKLPTKSSASISPPLRALNFWNTINLKLLLLLNRPNIVGNKRVSNMTFWPVHQSDDHLVSSKTFSSFLEIVFYLKAFFLFGNSPLGILIKVQVLWAPWLLHFYIIYRQQNPRTQILKKNRFPTSYLCYLLNVSLI